jgi:DNA mismatch repair protein MSH5
VGCAGAILSYLSRRRTLDYLPNDEPAQVAFQVKTIEMFTFSDLMFVNSDTLASLQIIQSESHPNSHMQGPNKSTSGAKESLSVYGLFYHLTSTPQGKQKLRQIFLRPSLDLSIIEERLKTIGVLLRHENVTSLEKICRSLKKIKDMRTVVIHLQKGISDASGKLSTVNRGVWASLLNFSFHMLKITEAVRELNDGQILAIAAKVRSPPILRWSLTRSVAPW